MKNWKNDHIFRILSDPNSTEDQWLSAIDELGQKDAEVDSKVPEKQPVRWALGFLGFTAGILVVALAYFALLSAGKQSEMILPSLFLAALLALCQFKNKVFSSGLNAGILLSILSTPTLVASYWSFEDRLWQSSTIVYSLFVYVGWTLLIYALAGKPPFERPVRKSEQSNCVEPIVVSPMTASTLPGLQAIQQNNKQESEYTSVVPLRMPGAPYLVAIENLKDRPGNSAEKVLQIATLQSEKPTELE